MCPFFTSPDRRLHQAPAPGNSPIQGSRLE
jgi:hypothetical protein